MTLGPPAADANPTQREAYAVFNSWSPRKRDEREDVAMRLIAILERERNVRGKDWWFPRELLARQLRIKVDQLGGVVRDARVMMAIGTGLPPAVNILSTTDGYYQLGNDRAALLWLRTNARYIATRLDTMDRVAQVAGSPNVKRRVRSLALGARRAKEEIEDEV